MQNILAAQHKRHELGNTRDYSRFKIQACIYRLVNYLYIDYRMSAFLLHKGGALAQWSKALLLRENQNQSQVIPGLPTTLIDLNRSSIKASVIFKCSLQSLSMAQVVLRASRWSQLSWIGRNKACLIFSYIVLFLARDSFTRNFIGTPLGEHWNLLGEIIP